MFSSTRIFGFDHLRVFAIGLVLLQHQLSILGLEASTTIWGVDYGQTGVAIFLAISGALAANSNHAATVWLKTRLLRIYPAYWIITAIGFTLTAMSGYKEFGVAQVISQFVGTGLYTHEHNLVNVATWFVSLLITLYLLIFIAKLTGKETLVVSALALSAGLAIVLNFEALLCAHALAFLSGHLLAKQRVHRKWVFVLALVFAGMIPIHGYFFYVAFALFTIAAIAGLSAAPKPIALCSNYSYEFYLCHSIFLVGAQRFFGDYRIPSILIGLAAACAFAVVLNYVTVWVVDHFQARSELAPSR